MDLNPEQLILGVAQGFDARTLEPFALSLRRSGCRGRCRVFVAARDKEAQAFLTAHGIEVEVFASAYAQLQMAARALHLPHRAQRLLEFLMLRTLEPFAMRGGARSLAAYGRLAPLDPTALRYVLYHGLLTGPEGADVKRVLLLGATLGDARAVLAYVRAMIREVARAGGWRFVPPRGFDQGCHNHLLHHAPPAPVTGLKNGAAPVVHLYHRKPEQLAFSPEGLLLNDDGAVVPVVHQWDRHPATFAPALARLRGE